MKYESDFDIFMLRDHVIDPVTGDELITKKLDRQCKVNPDTGRIFCNDDDKRDNIKTIIKTSVIIFIILSLFAITIRVDVSSDSIMQSGLNSIYASISYIAPIVGMLIGTFIAHNTHGKFHCA